MNDSAVICIQLVRSRVWKINADRLLTVVAFASIYVIWGTTFLAIRYAIETIPPLFVAGTRHLIAGLVLAAWCLWSGKKISANDLRTGALLGFLFFFLSHGALHWAEQVVASSLAALVIATEPIWVVLLKRWTGDSPLTARTIIGLLVGLAAVGLIAAGPEIRASRETLIGGAVVLFSAIAWSIGLVYSSRRAQQADPLVMSSVSMISGALLLFIGGIAIGEARDFHVGQVSMRSAEAMAYLVIFGSLLAYTCYMWLVRRYPPEVVATHTYVNPVVAVLVGTTLAKEHIGSHGVLAAVMVIVAIALVGQGSRTRKRMLLERQEVESVCA
jgi:drug/metabolite transporter (DMT)-like permease